MTGLLILADKLSLLHLPTSADISDMKASHIYEAMVSYVSGQVQHWPISPQRMCLKRDHLQADRNTLHHLSETYCHSVPAAHAAFGSQQQQSKVMYQDPTYIYCTQFVTATYV